MADEKELRLILERKTEIYEEMNRMLGTKSSVWKTVRFEAISDEFELLSDKSKELLDG